MEEGRITCNSMHACVRKVEWISAESTVPPDRREFMPVEVPLVTVEAGSPFRKIGEEVTSNLTFVFVFRFVFIFLGECILYLISMIYIGRKTGTLRLLSRHH